MRLFLQKLNSAIAFNRFLQLNMIRGDCMFRIRLKELRENSGYSQQSFADAFGVAQSTVGGWEAGKREPNFETTIKIASFFRVSVDYLLGNNNEGESVLSLLKCSKNEAATSECDSLRTELINLYDNLSQPGQDRALSYLRYLSKNEDK